MVSEVGHREQLPVHPYVANGLSDSLGGINHASISSTTP